MDCSQYANCPSPPPPPPFHELPFTGFEAWAVVLLAVVIIASGVALRLWGDR